MPKVIGIDEFKGNTGCEKYQCILTDIENHKVIDILPNRFEYSLIDYFKDLKRDDTEFFVSDMWRTYANIAHTYFKKATYVIDKYHFVRQVSWAFESVRKEAQRKFNKQRRIYFKRSKKLLLKRYDDLDAESKEAVRVMLNADESLYKAYWLKEDFYDIMKSQSKEEAKKKISNWILQAENSKIKRFSKCANTMRNWFQGICNSFDCAYTNGFTEGCNNKIKVLKRNAYGYRNFSRLRNRILHIFA
jgi:transposase